MGGQGSSATAITQANKKWGRQVRRHVGGQGSSTTAITQANKKWGDGETGKETSGGTRQQRHGHHTGKQEVGRQVRRQVGGQGSSTTAITQANKKWGDR